MKLQRPPLMVIGIILGAALGALGAHVWIKKPAWFPSFQFVSPDHGHANESNSVERGGESINQDKPRDGKDAAEPSVVKLSPEAARKFGIETESAAGGELEQTLNLPGQIVPNADRLAHIVPRVAGIVSRVEKYEGNSVQAGELLAILESRDLAEANAAYLASQQRKLLADATLKSAEELHNKKIMADLDFLRIRKEQVEATIDASAAENKLYSLGVSKEEIEGLPSGATGLANYDLHAPFAGTVVQKHCSLGEFLSGEEAAYQIADLSTVWVSITVFTQHLPLIQVGQPITIIAGRGGGESSAVIDYLSPVLDEDTRTATARVTLPNPDGNWRPGLFVSARVRTSVIPVTVLVPKTAVQTVQGDSSVFVESGGEFRVRPVTTGRSDNTRVEITAGLKPGERYVSANAFTLKSELEKAGFGEE